MRFLLLAVLALTVVAAVASEGTEKKEKKKVTKLQIGIKKRAENCKVKSRRGDALKMHYRVSSQLIESIMKINLHTSL